MKLLPVSVLLLSIVCMRPAVAQFNSSVSNGNLGAMLGYGWSEGPAVDESALFSQGTYKTRTSVYAFIFNFATMSGNQGLGWGGFFSGALGGSSDKIMGEDLGAGWSNVDGKWGEDFGLFFDGKIGPSLTYSLPDQQMRFGIRYFNWYQANVFGSTYGNSDDAASLGVTVDWRKLGLAYSFGSESIPGVLVDSHAWDSHEIEAKYLVMEKKSLSVLVGVRGLVQILQASSGTRKEPDTQGNLLGVFIAIR